MAHGKGHGLGKVLSRLGMDRTQGDCLPKASQAPVQTLPAVLNDSKEGAVAGGWVGGEGGRVEFPFLTLCSGCD